MASPQYAGEKQYGGQDLFVARYSPGSEDESATNKNQGGALQWTGQFGSAGDETLGGLVATAQGLFLAGTTTGNFAGNIPGSDAGWVMKLV